MNRSLLVALIGCTLALTACIETAPEEDEAVAEVEEALSCAPVEYCPSAKKVAETCYAEGREVTTGPCGCTTCTKLEGESCGGQWNIQGTCSSGLSCKVSSWQGSNSTVIPFGLPGVCVQ